jgi:hypothetical protein
MSIPKQVALERLRYWHGQRLRARDFRDQTAIEAQLRWWHNRALHNAFGVSLGLTVSPVPASGSLTAVRVTCGLAYDCFGRELILQDTREISVPTAPPPQGNLQVTPMTLLLRYKDSAQFPQRNDLAAVCLPCAGSSFQEEPDFVWQPADRVQVTDGVPLARVNFDNQIAILDQQFTAPLSRPLARPYLASGATLPEHTVWEPWSIEVGEQLVQIGAQTKIDTSVAGFTSTPCYFAWLQGSLTGVESQRSIFPYFANIAEASPTGFTFRLLLPRFPRRDQPDDDVPTAERGSEDVQMMMVGTSALRSDRQTRKRVAPGQGLYVCWLGCQMEKRPAIVCPTPPRSQAHCP